MFDRTRTSLEELEGAIFEAQPTPMIAYSRSDGAVLLANRAARRLFALPYSLVGRSVTRLPIVSAVSGVQIKSLLLGEKNGVKKHSRRSSSMRDQDFWGDEYHDGLFDDPLSPSKDEDDLFSGTRQAEVRIARDAPLATVISRMTIASLSLSDESIYMLTFERPEPSPSNNVGLSRLQLSSRNGSSTSLNNPRGHQSISRSGTLRSGTFSSASVESEAHLQTRFAELRDAIYFNESSAGFLLSADETFCYPSYTGSKDVTPVEIDDVGLFFDSWDLWDEHFNARLLLSEYPSIWLNRHRTKWKNRRYGLIESGAKLIIETSGDPLYDSDEDYIGGVVWVRTLGEYNEVIARDLEDTLADFKTICDRLPHILWTTNPQGMVDYFSQSWYEFTGLSEAESLGHEFQYAIHPDDMQMLWPKLQFAAGSIEELYSEARYRDRKGAWVWHALKAKAAVGDDGRVLKWYGSSTDIHDLVMQRLEADRTRAQVVGMLTHAEVALYRISSSWELSEMDGSTFGEGNSGKSSNIFKRLQQLQEDGAPRLAMAVRQVMRGEMNATVLEQELDSRWYRCRLLRDVDESYNPPIIRVLTCLIDMTENRQRAALEAENVRLTTERTIEMEKSSLKSAFLAHMSHE